MFKPEFLNLLSYIYEFVTLFIIILKLLCITFVALSKKLSEI